MPGWQSFYEQHASDEFELLTVAMDMQGAKVAKPWVEKADATYPALVDQSNKLGTKFQYNYVPLIILFNEQGRRVYGPQNFSIGDSEDRELLTGWLNDEPGVLAHRQASDGGQNGEFSEAEAALRFQYANYLLRNDQKASAVKQLEKALTSDPDNWIIHKQIWAIEHPEKFYDGNVDFGWQKEQLEREAQQNE
ncbi:MAG TPA: TlpA disulfide reductase family protein [bacterium]|nr:TlpA disulfide reductase family protein [bacterium]